jgi:hypothetical protein
VLLLLTNRAPTVSCCTSSHHLLKGNSHIACRAPAVPLPCRAVNGLGCVFPIWFTQCDRVWFTLAMPCRAHAVLRPCRSESDFSKSRNGRGMGTAWHVWINIGRRKTESLPYALWGYIGSLGMPECEEMKSPTSIRGTVLVNCLLNLSFSWASLGRI